MTARDELIRWLNNAYSMEVGMVEVLQRHVQEAREFPHLAPHFVQHLQETERHAAEIKRCIESLGGHVSAVKTLLGDVLGRIQGISSGMFRDQLVKNALSDYAAEHFEMACYQSLIVAAEEAGEPQIAETCRRILKDEEATANWLFQQIMPVTRDFLRKTEAEHVTQ